MLDPPSDLGILFVHGIGRQAQGETLLSAASPLIDWLKKNRSDCKFSIESVYLKPGRRPEHPPAYAVVSGRLDDKPTKILLAESWWAEEFYAPSSLTFAFWLLRFGAWVLLREVADQISDRIEGCAHRLHLSGDFNEFFTAIVIPAVTGPPIFALAVAPFQLCVLLLALLSQIRIFKIGEYAARGLRFLAEVIGDSYIYASDPLSRHAVLTRISEDLTWLQSCARRVTVVAHSQGAAAAFDALLWRPADCGLLTYGEGIRKLYELELQTESPSVGFRLTQFSWVYSVGSVWAVSIIFEDIHRALAGATQGWPEAGLAWTYVFAGAFLAYLITALNRNPERVDERILKKADKLATNNILWTDLTATADLVSGGLLLRHNPSEVDQEGWIRWPSLLANFRSARVRNTLNPLADHTSYWKSHDDFLPRVVATLQQQSSLPLSPPDLAGRLRSSSRSRAFRSGIRLGLHSALFAMSAVLYYRLGGNCRAWLQKLLGEWLTKAVASYGTIPAVLNFFLWLLGLALHFVAVWLWIGFLTGPLWQAWDLGSSASTRPQRISRYLALLGFVVFVIFGVVLMWVAIEKGTYSAIPEEVLRLALRLHRAVFL
jgi:hypothetical protein